MLPWITRVAQRTKINILLATGLYVTGELPRLFGLRGPGTLLGGPDPMTEMFVRELSEGIGDTGVRAAVVKCVTDVDGLTPAVRRAVQAAGEAAAATGALVVTHADAGTRQGLAQQQLLADCGVNLSRVVIGHCSDSGDLGYLTALVERGSCVGMDRFLWAAPQSFDQRVDSVAELCRRGFASQIVLSEDASYHHAWLDDEAAAILAPGSTAKTVPDRVIPALRARDVSDDDIQQMLVANPRRLLSGTSAEAREP
jgi:phosphotriesterase-related protein